MGKSMLKRVHRYETLMIVFGAVFVIGFVLCILAISIDGFLVYGISGILLFPSGLIGFTTSSSNYKICKSKLEVIKKERKYLKTDPLSKDTVIDINDYRRFIIDKAQKTYYFTPNLSSNSYAIHSLESIIDVDLKENNSVLISGGNSASGAFIGGLLGGTTGAIIGSSTGKISSESVVDTLQINIVTNDIDAALVQMELLDRKLNRDSEEYRELMRSVQTIYSTLSSYLKTNKETT